MSYNYYALGFSRTVYSPFFLENTFATRKNKFLGGIRHEDTTKATSYIS